MSVLQDKPEGPLLTGQSPRPSPANSSARFQTSTVAVGAWVTAVVVALLTWQLVSSLSGQWVPSLTEVGKSLIAVLSGPILYADGLITLRRVFTVLLASVMIGVVVGLAAGYWTWARSFIRPILVVALAIPDLVYIIMAILILGATESSGIIAIVVAIAPLTANVVLGSMLARDTGLDEMAQIYKIGKIDYIHHVLLHQLRPALSAALKTGFAFSWKLVVLMETITTSDGIGARIYESFRFLRPQEMIAYALVFIVVMKCIEALFTRLMLFMNKNQKNL